MNIFALDENPTIAAKYHNDNHVRKMILESAVLMALSYPSKNTLPPKIRPYWQKTQHNNHCSIWTRTATGNYEWVARLAIALCEEYTYRTGKIHASQPIVEWLSRNPSPTVPNSPLQPFALAIAPACKMIPNAIEAYRFYYMYYKDHLAKWTKRGRPDWYTPIEYMI